MPTVDENLGWNAYDWSHAGEEWSSGWGDSAQMWHGTILPRIHRALPARHVLEIAPGFGRCTRYLLPLTERLTVVDLAARCIDACRERFRGAHHLSLHVNDGRSLPMVDAGSVDFVFSWDSLVHVEADVMAAYVAEIARVLRPGGGAFLHHSNLAAALASGEPMRSEHWRGKTMSAALLREQAAAAGLRCVSQELVPWGGDALIDAWSTLRAPVAGEPASPPTMVREHRGFQAETALQAKLAEAGRPLASASVGDARPLRHRLVDELDGAIRRAAPGVHRALFRAVATLKP